MPYLTTLNENMEHVQADWIGTIWLYFPCNNNNNNEKYNKQMQPTFNSTRITPSYFGLHVKSSLKFEPSVVHKQISLRLFWLDTGKLSWPCGKNNSRLVTSQTEKKDQMITHLSGNWLQVIKPHWIQNQPLVFFLFIQCNRFVIL